MREMNKIVGDSDILWITLDTLRWDVAQDAFWKGELPNISKLMPSTGWEERHSPGSFTYAAHHAFFSGFLPTLAKPGPHPRLFAARFPGSETTAPNTFTFEEATLPEALSKSGYRTHCIGGVGFFNKQTALGSVLPGLFDESEWKPSWGVTSKHSAQLQFERAAEVLAESDAPHFLFINVSAIHQPNCHYLPDCQTDGLESHRAALRYVDSTFPILLDALKRRSRVFGAVFGDHGTAYGEDGFYGHRNGLSSVMNVPYFDFLLENS